MNKKEQAMRQEARAAIIETLQDGYSGYYCDLHNEVFNTDYYIIGTHEAKEALKEYDVFKALEKVQTYEKDNFGEIYTDLSDPEKLINMLYYIIGEEVLIEIMDGIEAWEENWNNLADEETNAEILQALGESMFPTYAWPGGYPLFYFDHEGAVLCPKCARDFPHQVQTDKEGKPLVDINWEDPNLYCDECGKRIESAYAEED